ncbi:Cell division control protein 45 [Trichostrongylus colubriformis]|uniref:Cell division control protein 45 n=1 Tax=Trichostrongylus colubriformis TaxID=6319 RepID=A0AAN8J3A6_TRICO
MLIQDNLRGQFYDIIRKSHVLVIVGEDVDALCAYTVLSQLFICDDVSFSMVPVSGWDALDRTFREHYDQSPTIVLINCGGNRSLQDMQIPEGSKVFVIDSRRPFHHENIFEAEQIMVLVDSAEVPKLNIPEVSSVMEDEESEDSEDGDDEEGETTTRMQKLERRLLKKEAKKQWLKRRKNILWKYYENAWYSISSAVRMLELAAALNKATPEFLWVAAVGLNSQWTDKVITVEAYHDVCIDRMRPFIQRFSPRNTGAKADDLLRVSFEKELPLAMYSHWSLYRAMAVNEHFACKTRNWTQKGDSEVKHLLADLGLTLNETRQKFEAMKSARRKEVMQTLEKEMTPSFASFIAHFGYSSRVCAADVARGLAARLESPRRIPLVERFESARGVLRCFMKSHQDYGPLVKCFDLYKVGLESVWSLMASAVNQQEVLPIGPFFLYTATNPCDEIMDSRHFVFLFTTFLQRAFCSVRRSRDRTTKPFVVSLVLSGDLQGWHAVTGVMPLDTVFTDAQLMSFMGRAFERAAEQAHLDVRRDNFDPNVILVRSEDRSRFFDLLQAVMEIES